MFNKYLSKRIVAFVLCISTCMFLFSGCGIKENSLFDLSDNIYPVTELSNDTFSQDCLSDSVCIIPKASQSKKDSNMTAGASLIVNDTSDTMLYSQNIYKKLYPASVTKIVTTLVTLENANLDDTVTFSYNATHIKEVGAVVCGFDEGDKIKLKDLLYCFLIYSGMTAA